MRNNIGLLTDVDLDGAGSSIVLRSVYEVNEFERARYAELSAKMDALSANNENLIIADLALEKEQLTTVLKSFKKVQIFDHHERSLEYAKIINTTEKFTGNISDKKCSTMLAYDYHRQVTGADIKRLSALVKLINVYDLWLIDNEFFQMAYDLNVLFWEIGYYDFYDSYKDGFNGFKNDHKNIIKELNDAKEKKLAETPFIELESGSAIWITEDGSLTNDFTLKYPDYKVYYIIRYDGYKGRYVVSLRLRRFGKWAGKLDLNKAVRDTWERGFISPDMIVSCGGHKEAAGVDFAKNITTDDIMMIIEAVDKKVTEQHDKV